MILLVVANPGTTRALAVQASAERLELDFELLPYGGLLDGSHRLDARLHTLLRQGPVILRFDSPGGAFPVERALIAHGASVPDPTTACNRISEEDALTLEYSPGQLRFPRQGFLGWRRLMQTLTEQLSRGAPHSGRLTLMNHPDDIAAMFDKPTCHARMLSAALPVPEALGIGIQSLEALEAAMQAAHLERVFVKLANGSSAVGVVALERTPRGDLRAITSTRRSAHGGTLAYFNSLRLSTYTDRAELADVIGFIAREGAQIERWIPKTRFPGTDRPCDIRVLAVDGHAAHCVVRIGQSPMTNLHLGNERAEPWALREFVGEDVWQQAMRAAEDALALFPHSFYAGLDLLFGADASNAPAIIEINAFGDLLNNTTHEGLPTVEYELSRLLARMETTS